MFLNRVSQDQKNNVPLMEKNMETLLNKFKKNQELIDRFKRIHIDTEKLYHNDLMTSKNENTFQRINTTSKLEMRPNNTIKSAHSTDIHNYTSTNIEKNTNLLNSSSKKHLNHELAKTPEIIKCKLNSNDNNYLKQESIKINENKKISRFKKSINTRKIKEDLKMNKKNIIYGYNFNHRQNNNKNFLYKNDLKIHIKKDNFKSSIFTERNNNSIKKTNYQSIFNTKLFRNREDNISSSNTLGLNKNYTSRGELHYINKYESMGKTKIKNFLSKNDFYFY
jgi:hypothetical protein